MDDVTTFGDEDHGNGCKTTVENLSVVLFAGFRGATSQLARAIILEIISRHRSCAWVSINSAERAKLLNASSGKPVAAINGLPLSR